MAVKIDGIGINNGSGKSITPRAVADMGQYGSPSVARGHNVSSVTSIQNHRTQVTLLQSMGDTNYVVAASCVRDFSNTSRDIITCIDGESSISSTSFTIRTENEASTNLDWDTCQFAIWN